MGSVYRLEMSPRQMCAPCSQRIPCSQIYSVQNGSGVKFGHKNRSLSGSYETTEQTYFQNKINKQLGHKPTDEELTEYIRLKKTGSSVTVNNLEHSMNEIFQLFVEINDLVSLFYMLNYHYYKFLVTLIKLYINMY